jgi:hypothetical protein
MFKHVVLAFALVLIGGASIASQNCTDRPRAEWMSQDAVSAKLKEQGYDVRKVENKKSCYEAKVRDSQGVKYELYVDPTSGRVVEKTRD